MADRSLRRESDPRGAFLLSCPGGSSLSDLRSQFVASLNGVTHLRRMPDAYDFHNKTKTLAPSRRYGFGGTFLLGKNQRD